MAGESLPNFRFRHLYFDTNILFREGWPRVSAKLENLLSLAQSIGVTVYLPEAVERELEARWLRAYTEKWGKLQEHLDPLQKHLNRLAAARVPSPTMPEFTEVQTVYGESVNDTKKTWQIGTAPIPELGTAVLLDFAIGRKVIVAVTWPQYVSSNPYDLGNSPGSWTEVGAALIQVEVEAIFTGETYSDVSFLSARLKPLTLPVPPSLG
jgi:hypothetical protein